MNQITIITQEALYLTLLISAPPVVLSLIVGFIISVFQATTQIQEQTLSFAPKVIAVFGSLALAGSWMGAQLMHLTFHIFDRFPELYQAMNLAELFNQTTGFNLTPVLLTAALLAGRVLPIVIFSPFLGGDTVPSEVKIGLTFMVVLVLFPGVSGQITHIPTSTFPFIFLMFKEVFVGLCISFVVSMVFDAARSAGGLIDTAAGANMAQVLNPQTQQQSTIFSNLQYQLAVCFFLVLNGHHVVINSLADSLVNLPLDTFPHFSHGQWPFFNLVLKTFGELLSVALSLSAPGVLAAFMTDLGLGMVNRVAPQIQVFFIAMSVKPMVAVLLALITLQLTLDRLLVEFRVVLDRVPQMLQLMQ